MEAAEVIVFYYLELGWSFALDRGNLSLLNRNAWYESSLSICGSLVDSSLSLSLSVVYSLIDWLHGKDGKSRMIYIWCPTEYYVREEVRVAISL